MQWRIHCEDGAEQAEAMTTYLCELSEQYRMNFMIRRKGDYITLFYDSDEDRMLRAAILGFCHGWNSAVHPQVK